MLTFQFIDIFFIEIVHEKYSDNTYNVVKKLKLYNDIK